MPIDELLSTPLTGINAFNELVIDAAIWNEAHNQHLKNRELHAASAHRPGVVYGLDVIPAGGARVLIAPGIAVNRYGESLILLEPAEVEFTERGQSFLTLVNHPVFDKSSERTISGGGKAYYRRVEGVTVTASNELPDEGSVELARIVRANAANSIQEPKNPFDPGRDELNTLHRPIAFPFCATDTTVGELDYVTTGSDVNAWKINRPGIVNLLREGSVRGFKADFLGPGLIAASAPAGLREPAMLYTAGVDGFRPLGEKERDKLWRFLGEGTLLVGEQVGNGKGFEDSFRELVESLGAKLKPVTRDNPLLYAQYLFGEAPAGANGHGTLLADLEIGVVLSTFNYGGAWQGDVSLSSGETMAIHARERIRQAQEFGLNLLATAAKRRRTHQLKQLHI